MVQTQKIEVRERLLRAAEEVFASSGYAAATMAEIASVADISTGNIYRYFKGKDELFYAVFTDEFANTLMRLLRRRVGALLVSGETIVQQESQEDPAEELLRFWIDHRLKAAVILGRCEGSRFGDFGAKFVAELVRLTIANMKSENPELRVTQTFRFTLETIFKNTLRTILSILETHQKEAEIRRAFAAFWSYQLAGLAGFSEWARNDES